MKVAEFARRARERRLARIEKLADIFEKFPKEPNVAKSPWSAGSPRSGSAERRKGPRPILTLFSAVK
jgi:hypothetical protein